MAILGDTKAVSLSLLDGVIGNLNPKTTNVYDLGTSSLKWRNIYGALKGNADTATSATSATSATKATQDGNGNVISSTYLKLSGGTMTGGVTFVGNQNSAYNDKGIIFTKGSRIGENTNGGIGVYGVERVYIRPGCDGSSSGDGIEISTAGVTPSNNNSETLGDSSHKWFNVYATTFTGNLVGNADTATSATSATTATNLSAAPSLATSGTTQITVTAGGKTSSAYTVPYATSAGSVALSGVTGADDLKAIEALSGTTGILKKTAANTWTLDTTAYTTNTGTVTKVTAGTGLSIGTTAGGNFTTTGTINHTNSVTAQTTQALYPIKIDAQGHISAYGSAVTSLPASDVSAWAKAATKPSYTFSEIGSKPTTVSGYGITDAVAGNGRVFYGTCATAAATAAKEVTCAAYDALTAGDILIVKFTNTNSAAVANLTLNVNGKGAKNIKKLYNTTGASNLAAAAELNADGIAEFVYNGTYWILTNADYNTTYYYTSIYCTTAAATAAKVGSISSVHELTAGKYFQVWMYYTNSAASALTLNISNTGAKPIYINGAASSASNYTLPRGCYIVYYDGTNYHFRTDGELPGNINGYSRSIKDGGGTVRKVWVNNTLAAPSGSETGDIVLYQGGLSAGDVGAVSENGADGMLIRDTNVVSAKPIYTPLWEDTTNFWTIGETKTIAGLSNYHLFAIRVANASTGSIQETYILGILSVSGAYLRGNGGYASSSSADVLFFLTCTVSGDDITLVNCHNLYGSSFGSRADMSIVGIYGIL